MCGSCRSAVCQKRYRPADGKNITFYKTDKISKIASQSTSDVINIRREMEKKDKTTERWSGREGING